MLNAGDLAPDFTLDGPDGPVTLSSLLATKGTRFVVLYFYPKDNTPGCTREGQAFSAAAGLFARAGAKVFGVSKDSLKSHASFAASCSISVPMLSDPDLTVHKAFGAYGEKTMYGKKVTGTIRSTFVIGNDRKLVRVFGNVKVDGHAEAVLAVVEGRGTTAPPTKVAPAKKAAAAKKTTPAKKAAAPSKTAPRKSSAKASATKKSPR